MNLYLTETKILKDKIQNICSHVLQHAHTLIGFGILYHDNYMCFLTVLRLTRSSAPAVMEAKTSCFEFG